MILSDYIHVSATEERDRARTPPRELDGEGEKEERDRAGTPPRELDSSGNELIELKRPRKQRRQA